MGWAQDLPIDIVGRCWVPLHNGSARKFLSSFGRTYKLLIEGDTQPRSLSLSLSLSKKKQC